MDGGEPTREICPSESTILGFLDRRLTSEQRAALDVHLDVCASCRRLVVEVSGDWQLSSTVGEAHTTHRAYPHGEGELLARGTVVGRFVVLDLLGAGGMGIVYKAYDPELDRKVALKLLLAGAGAAGELLAEAQVTARISHANVIAIYDVGTFRGQVFAAMELVEGATLRRWMAERPRTWREVVDVFAAAGEGLAAAHDAGVVHRDFKPENVLLGRDGRIKVSDFGLAADPCTHVAGTPAYLPVEGYEPGGADARGDQFSFCVALHEALHGRRPFAGETLPELIAAVRRGPQPDGADRRVPARLLHVVRRGLAFAPEDRYPTMRALLGELRRAVAAHRRRWWLAGGAGALALAVGATATMLDRHTPAPQLPCADAAARLAGVWDPARREAVEAAFQRTQAPGAGTAFARVAATVDRYAAEWAAIRTEACEATEIHKVQSPALLELRMACLDRARIQLRALADALSNAEAETVRGSVTAAAALPALDACSDLFALNAIVAPPLTLAARAEVAAAPPDATAFTSGDPTLTGWRPDFRLPFACGESWQLAHRVRRGGAAEVDFALPDGASAAGLAVVAAAPGWVARVSPEAGEVVIGHGAGWFSSYEHMIDISVTLHQYIGRGHVLGRVGNVNVKNSLGGPGRSHLHYTQRREGGTDGQQLVLEREGLDLASGSQIRVSTNNCPAGGAPGGAAHYDVPLSTAVFSVNRWTMEVATRRADDHVLFERWYNRGWNGAPLQHTIVGQPAVAVFQGELHVIARKSDGTLFDMRYSPFSGWKTTYIDGKVGSDPDAVVYTWRKDLQVTARGSDGVLYRWWTAGGDSWSRRVAVGNPTPVVGTPAIASHFDALYIVARTADHGLRIWRADRSGVLGEASIANAAAGDPDVAVDPRTGLVNIIARGPDDRLYRWQSQDRDHGERPPVDRWSTAELIDPMRRVTGSPAAVIYEGALHVLARSADGAVHHWWREDAWRWQPTGGTYTGSPDAVMFGAQLQTIGRGIAGTLHTVWYDPVSVTWNVENHDVQVAE